MSSNQTKKQILPPQHQNRQPGLEAEMEPRPLFGGSMYKPAGKLQGKKAVITGGDSGIGRAVAIAFAKEGADVAIVYLNEHEDAEETKRHVEEAGRKCVLLPGDAGDETFCREAIARTVKELGTIDLVVNNAAEQHPQNSIADITSDQLLRTFQTNVFAMFYVTKAALPHLKSGSCIINTASITAYLGSPQLLDYSATKGAVVSFTRSLSGQLVQQGIRVNGVAPGPIWTPLIPSTFQADQVATFGSDTPMQRPGQPEELAAAYVFLACGDSTYMTGQMLHINGGEIVNG
ncbi:MULTISPECIES: SDR family oxidoreductase [unclassified Paenibacillus]|uniref:SDR family oxidoreductase n=1 Tax=unclassified Paenibacillus TaxID=185978 RepID=UPI001C1216CD|nr:MULTISPECIES: SDR family oxidoreductase [unclassified Paenibacillus]MBU5441590.1 SDR family oxidoreductase [Paenibacillus sp. MSJ-34]CAH0117740.1 General stress protein 39 [Paenibacillus sp. CECT 9249]